MCVCVCVCVCVCCVCVCVCVCVCLCVCERERAHIIWKLHVLLVSEWPNILGLLHTQKTDTKGKHWYRGRDSETKMHYVRMST